MMKHISAAVIASALVMGVSSQTMASSPGDPDAFKVDYFGYVSNNSLYVYLDAGGAKHIGVQITPDKPAVAAVISTAVQKDRKVKFSGCTLLNDQEMNGYNPKVRYLCNFVDLN